MEIGEDAASELANILEQRDLQAREHIKCSASFKRTQASKKEVSLERTFLIINSLFWGRNIPRIPLFPGYSKPDGVLESQWNLFSTTCRSGQRVYFGPLLLMSQAGWALYKINFFFIKVQLIFNIVFQRFYSTEIQLYIIYIYIFFRFSFRIGYYKILNIVPYAIH